MKADLQKGKKKTRMERKSFLSSEEEEELIQSDKKVKEVHHGETVTTPRESLTSTGPTFELRNDFPKPSFKEKLVGEIPRAFAQAFDLTKRMEAEEGVEVA